MSSDGGKATEGLENKVAYLGSYLGLRRMGDSPGELSGRKVRE